MPASSPSSFEHNRTRLRVALLVALMLVIATAIISVIHLRQVAEQRVHTDIRNMARSIEQSIEGRINTIDVVLQNSVDEIRRLSADSKLEKPIVTAFFERQMRRVPDISYLRATNERGDIIYGVDDNSQTYNVADRDYFIKLRNEPVTDRLISQFVIAKVADRWSWLFVRPIIKANGSFGGVVIAGMLASDLDSTFSALTLASADSISLRDPDMKLIARYAATSWKDIPAGDQKLSDDFAKALAKHPREGDYVSGKTSFDGISRMHTYRVNPKYGFNINIGISIDDAFSVWRKQVMLASALVIAFALVSLFFSRIIHRAWRVQEAALAELDARQDSLSQAQHIARLGRYVYDLKGDRWTSCDILDNIFGIDTDHPRNVNSWLNLIVPESRQALQDALSATIKNRQLFNREYVIARASDGEQRWVHDLGKLQFDEAGQPIRLVGTIQDITEQKRLEERLHHEATTDRLTGIANRGRFLELATNEIARATRLGRPVSLVLIDIDAFKAINDEYGHQTGDEALRLLAQVGRQHIREIDLFARVGGDEFVLLLPEATAENAFETVERLREALAAASFPAGNRTSSITISAGVAAIHDQNDTLDALIRRADKALYASKHAGRNRCTISQQ